MIYRAINLDRMNFIDYTIRTLRYLPGITDLIIVIDPNTHVREYKDSLTALAGAFPERRIWLRIVDSTEMKNTTRRWFKEKFNKYLAAYSPIIYGVEVINEAGIDIAGKFQHEKALIGMNECSRYPQLKTMACYYLDGDALDGMEKFIASGPRIDADLQTISFYERSSLEPTKEQPLIQGLRVLSRLFPSRQVGIGEYGAENAKGEYPDVPTMREQVLRYERINPGPSNFCGFGSYWDFAKFVVARPEGKNMWPDLTAAPLFNTFYELYGHGLELPKNAGPVADPNRRPGP